MSEIKLNRYYSTTLKDFVKEKYEKEYKSCPVFLVAEDLTTTDMVILPDPLKDVEFLGEKWEISGDYCLFRCITCIYNGDNDIVLRPYDMVSRDGLSMNSPDWDIKLKDMSELIMVIDGSW
jgi:hypothetical protein